LFKEFFRNDFGFGGNNGLTDFKDLLGFSLQTASMKAALFSASAIVLILAYVASRAIIGSKYGKALVAVRDAESRMRFLGYRVANYKLFVFVVSAIIAGIAGALYVPQVGIINPSEFAPGNSIEAAIWVAVGGRGTLIGAAIGAIAVNFAKTFFTGAFPEYWLYGLGGLFVLSTLFLPKGILGLKTSQLIVVIGVAIGATLGIVVVAFSKTWLTGDFAAAGRFGLGLVVVLITLFLVRRIFDLMVRERAGEGADP
jgi:urea transport system permease protein